MLFSNKRGDGMYSKLLSRVVLFLLFILINKTGNLYPQDENYNKVEIARSQYLYARSMTDNISEKLKLNPTQKKELINILLDYQDNLLNINHSTSENSELTGESRKSKTKLIKEAETSVEQQIVRILDRRQQGIYYRVKPEWWKRIREITFQKKK